MGFRLYSNFIVCATAFDLLGILLMAIVSIAPQSKKIPSKLVIAAQTLKFQHKPTQTNGTKEI